ncbi:protein of unknown function [Granulicella rosea]|uniref:DUF1844 domain-containing protein n=1 Tax=Granulicella rosea TaxID=474952 RepID=A0A239KLD4_9BACT|nr:DUF1844 domain-containing protein [Granulicella rosea]SNT18413.1 protein of unknown function [Granulicella rosea]
MPEQNKPFVITDRRKFTADGTPRPDADPTPERERPVAVVPEPAPEPVAAAPEPPPAPEPQAAEDPNDPGMPPPPTPEQMEQSRLAYQSTAERIDIAIRSANPGMDHPPAMSFDQIVQSVYMQAILQLGGGAQQGEQPQVDLLGARQSIDMLGILAEKCAGNLSAQEDLLLNSAIFELRLAFLEITQALARSAQARAGAPGAPAGGPPPRPSIVR